MEESRKQLKIEERFCDVTLDCEDKEIGAHKIR